MSTGYSCPCCGGDSDFTSDHCEYCGTPFLPQGGSFANPSSSLGQQIADMETQAVKTPNDGKLHFALGEAYHRYGDYDKAEKSLEKAAVLSPKEAKILHMLAWNAGIKNGWECVKVGQFADRAIGLKPDFQPAQAMKLLHNAAQLYLFGTRDDYNSVLEMLSSALKLDPENTYVYLYAATVYEESRQYVDAIKVLQKAGELSLKDLAPAREDARIFARLGFLYQKIGQVEEAKKALAKAVNLDPNNATARKLQKTL
ncbi:MAG TPA: hypothetical protein DCZ92_14745 [Elusimicrobia bacterium]|nr:MAG: hypothetical protein A2016_11940 [Elusimicrobia bacterium GWF2_62_30]HBA62040.1 hypothetical protein [Elusimicrobiota bacterium]